jgi:hypothetical protein
VNGFWDPLYYYKDQAAMFYTTFDLSGMYKEQKHFDDSILDFKYKLDKSIIDETKEHLKGTKACYGIVSSIKSKGTPELMNLATNEAIAYLNIIGFQTLGS